ncbi:glycoside hydrolase family 16 protein [bacterium]|nr:MAG: glycoside hydrolase family 16 protein [bacterium]
MTLNKIGLGLLLAGAFSSMQCSSDTTKITAPTKDGYKLVWSDEFDYNGLPDSEQWNFLTGDHGWGNNEKQNYVANDLDVTRVKDGMLTITTSLLNQGTDKQEYRSARLTTKQKGDWLYGIVEVKAKLPTGTGTWPAIWMLPTDNEYGGWPNSGEIDIMEHVGYEPNVVHGTVHTGAFNHMQGTQKGNQIGVPTATSDFHVYKVDWDEQQIDFFVDDSLYFSFDNTGVNSAEWPFDKRFHLILNIAIGGNWGGVHGIDNTVFPQSMVIDYVRVWEKLED